MCHITIGRWETVRQETLQALHHPGLYEAA